MKKLINILLLVGTILLSYQDGNAVTLKETPLEIQFAAEVAREFGKVSFADQDIEKQSAQNTNLSLNSGKVSFLKAGIYSALVPGLGEYYVGHRAKARVFFAVEAATWISFFSSHIYGNWKEDDMVQFAAEHANASLENKSDEFKDWVGFYDDIDQFNSLGRVQDQDRPYLVDNAENHWRWETISAQSTYRHLKNRSREAHRRRDFMVGLAVANRIVSIIDAIRDARRSQREIKDSEFSLAHGISYRIEIDPFNQDRPLVIALSKRF